MSHFGGTAWYYARFRPPYPAELFEQLAVAAGLGPASRVLDLACGTGPIAIPLAAHAGEVVALDVEEEMLEELRANAPPNVTAVHANADEIDASWGRFDLVTIGRALHWLGGGAFLTRLEPVTDQVALLGEGFKDSPSRAIVRDVARRFVGDRPKGSGDDVVYADALASSPFNDVVVLSAEDERVWTPDTLVGLAYSTSQASPLRLGDRREAFERELRASLEPRYVERGSMEVVLGRRREQ